MQNEATALHYLDLKETNNEDQRRRSKCNRSLFIETEVNALKSAFKPINRD